MGFSCKDPSVTYLNKYGYNVVKFPRAGIEPLLVLGRDRSLTPLGMPSLVWKTHAPAPVPGKPNKAANVEGQKTERLDLSVGLTLLANIISALGATTPSLDVAYKNARKVQFTLTNVWSVAISPFEIGEYLAAGDLNLANPVVAQFFDDDSSTAYIITEVLKSNGVSVTATNSDGLEVAVDVPAISGAVGAKVKVATGSEGSGTVTYQGDELITFGFKALEIVYAEGRWSVLGVKPSGDMAFAHAANENISGTVFNPGGLVRL